MAFKRKNSGVKGVELGKIVALTVFNRKRSGVKGVEQEK